MTAHRSRNERRAGRRREGAVSASPAFRQGDMIYETKRTKENILINSNAKSCVNFNYKARRGHEAQYSGEVFNAVQFSRCVACSSNRPALKLPVLLTLQL
jgi:hypothetical protein